MRELKKIIQLIPNLLISRKKAYLLASAWTLVIYILVSVLHLLVSHLLGFNVKDQDVNSVSDDLTSILLFSYGSALWQALPALLIWPLFAINIHRVTLLNKGLELHKDCFKIYLVFFWKYLLLGFWVVLLMVVPITTFHYQGGVGFAVENILSMFIVAISVIAGAFLLARVALVLPSAALGKPLSILQSWHLTQGHSILMIGVILVAPIALVILDSLFALLVMSLPDIVQIATTMAFSLITFVVEISLLSLAYYTLLKKTKRAA